MAAVASTHRPDVDAAPKVVEVRDVCKSFNDRPVLRNVGAVIAASETICLIGPSGSGKSTLLRCIDGLERPDTGSVVLEGQAMPSGGRELDRVRARIGMVFQQYNLFPHRTALDNVAFGLVHVKKQRKAVARAAALEHLEQVGLTQRASNYPHQLSGGEQQRVAIARALAMEPSILLFDEVTAALDPELVKGILDLIGSLGSQGRTMMLATHELRFARRSATKILFLDHGRVVEAGPPEQIFEDPRSERLKLFLSQML